MSDCSEIWTSICWDSRETSVHVRIPARCAWCARHAARGWATVQMDQREEPWCAACGTMPIQFEVQRAMKRADMWGLCVTWGTLDGQRLIKRKFWKWYKLSKSGEIACVSLKHGDVDWCNLKVEKPLRQRRERH